MFKVVVAVLLASLIILSACGPKADYVPLAKCLTEKGVKMYGTFWCPNCAKQKKMLGKEAFNHINYVECDARGKNPQTELCLEKGVNKYPHWEFPDSSVLIGEQEPELLAKKAGC